MIILRRFLIMLQFMTTIPLHVKLDYDSRDFGKGLAFAPLVGLIIGGALALIYMGLRLVFPPLITAVLLVAAYMLLTGGLHFDGLGDTFDGVFSNRSREKMLEIMHDSRIGTNAALAIICVVLIDAGLLIYIDAGIMTRTLIMMPVVGRLGCLIGAGTSGYARKGESLGRPFVDFCGIKEVVTGLFIYFAISFAAAGKEYMAVCTVPVILSLITSKYFAGKIGGVTGDILGAVCEINQAFFLVLTYLSQKYFF